MPSAAPVPVSAIVARMPPRERRESVTEPTVKLAASIGTVDVVSVKSGPPLDQLRPPARLSRRAMVLNGVRDQRRSATALPRVTVVASTRA